MRDIKFRAWNKNENCMIHSDEVYPKSKYKLEFEVFNDFNITLMKMTDRENVYYKDGEETYMEYFEPVDAVIMQFTGLKDVNGKEIYEGDIVEKEFLDFGHKDNFIGVVKFEYGSFIVENEKLKRGYYLFSETDINTVIGNIYENQELLK